MISKIRFGEAIATTAPQAQPEVASETKAQQPAPKTSTDSDTFTPTRSKAKPQTAEEKKEAEEALKRMQTAKLNATSTLLL